MISFLSKQKLMIPFLSRITFSDETTFYTNGKVNRHNVRVCGVLRIPVKSLSTSEMTKVSVLWADLKEAVFGPFFFQEVTVTGSTHLDMLQNWSMP